MTTASLAHDKVHELIMIMPGKRALPFLAATVAVVLSFFTSQPASAQRDTIPPRTLQQIQRLAPSEILRRLRESGLTREQVRERLRQAGYDPMLADRYFDQLERADTAAGRLPTNRITREVPMPTGSLIDGLRRIGVLLPGDTIVPADSVIRDTIAPRRRLARDSLELQIFGKELFSATTTQFQPILEGPVDPDYRVGPGDQITLIVTGDVELIYDLTVTREGYLVIPTVGQIAVAGLTIEQLRNRLNTRLARVYSGVNTGTTQFDLSMGRLRRNLVWIIGEVDIPGSYQVSGGATVFNALYQAGGPNNNGSFRTIEVRRGNRVIQQVDLYDYLLRGDKGGDIRLEQGDVVFVPVLDRRVTLRGSVIRPAIYELKPNETLIDVLAFAGGVEAEAAVDRIQIDRILPPGQRQPGRDRVLRDISLEMLRGGGTVPLEDGDVISVFTITSARRNRVTISGDIHRPGEYEWRPGMTALELVTAAQGLLPSAYRQAAHVVRLDVTDSTTVMVPVTFEDPADPNHVSRVALADLDEVFVFSRTRLVNPEQVEIFGLVKNEGVYPFSQNMSVQDLVLRAGGFQEGALEQMAEVARRVRTNGTDSLAVVYSAPLHLALSDTVNGVPAPAFILHPGDQVFIRRLPGFAPLRTIEINGEVTYPGLYTVESKQERVSSLIRRAGGVTREAYANGFRLFRDGKLVSVDLARALARPGGPEDMIVTPGDRLEVPKYDPLVLVTGAVAFETQVRWENGLDVEDYVRRAGGTLPAADESRIYVRYPNGALRTTQRTLGVRRYPQVQPGSTITVPQRSSAAGTDWDQIFTRTLAAISTLATLIVAYAAVK